MAFWNMVSIEPKRTFRYYVTFGAGTGLGGVANASQISMFATSVDRPKYEVSFKEFQYLNHQFNFPGRVKWSDVTMKFIDAGRSGNSTSPVLDVATLLMSVITKSGYTVPTSNTTDLKTLSKAAFNAQIGDMTIKVLGPDAASGNIATSDKDVVEEWKLYNVMFGNVSFSTLSYESEEFSTIDLTVKYDYATLATFTADNTRGTVIPAV